jgi:hypothetical protein
LLEVQHPKQLIERYSQRPVLGTVPGGASPPPLFPESGGGEASNPHSLCAVSIPALLGDKPRSTIRAWQRHSHERHRGRLTGGVEKPVAVPRTHKECSPSYEHPFRQYYDTDVQFGRACKKGASVLYHSGNFSRMPWYLGCLVDVGGGFDRARRL